MIIRRLLLAVTVAMLLVPAAAEAKNFTRMFPKLNGFAYTDQQSADLAAAMKNPRRIPSA